MVAMFPRSMISGASAVVREKVFLVMECDFLEIVAVFRKPKPWRGSLSVSCTVEGELCRTVSTGRSLETVDCDVWSVRRWLCPRSISFECNRVDRVSMSRGNSLPRLLRLRPSAKWKIPFFLIMKPRRK